MRGTSAKDPFIRKCLSVKTRGFFPMNKHYLEVMFTIVMCPRCLFFFFLKDYIIANAYDFITVNYTDIWASYCKYETQR